MSIKDEEYEKHKAKCSQSFDELFIKLDKLDRAMFGELDLKRKGVVDMTQEMYQSMMLANSGKRIFWITVSIAGAITTIIIAINLVVVSLKKITLD